MFKFMSFLVYEAKGMKYQLFDRMPFCDTK